MQRVIVVGPTGSGKSTLAAAIARAHDIPHVELDALFWEPEWTQPTDAVFLPKVAEAVAGAAWVLDGNYQRSNHLTWPRADTVVWLDLPLSLNLWQSVRRALTRVWRNEELWPGTGNKESLRKLVSQDSIIRWLLQTHGSVRARYEERLADPAFAHITFIRLRSRREVNQFVASLPRA